MFAVIYFRFNPDVDGKKYNIYGVTVLEVEVDILTGQHIVSFTSSTFAVFIYKILTYVKCVRNALHTNNLTSCVRR